ncbi:MAG: ABC transporter permease [Alphaproteobacteria bacterium]|nr:ABC transporter permease [Alphaproteobacteria bacterium]
MIAFIVNRLFQSVLVMLAVALIAFVLFQFAGDPLTHLVGLDVPAEERERLRQELGFNDPLLVQYLRFIANSAQGRFGISYQFSRPVAEVIGVRIPATLELSFVAAALALGLGIPMGVYAAIHRGRPTSRLFLAVSLAGISLPSFFLGILLIYIFAVQLGVLPSFGRGETVAFGWWTSGFFSASGWKSLILPAITLGLFQLAFVMRLVQSEMLEVLRADFIRFARARGLRDRAVHYGHALRNTLIPLITVAGLQIGSITAFAIITETVFQWPGVGALFISAIRTVDIPVMAAYLLLVGFFFVVLNLAVDLLYLAVDPRLRVRGGDGAGH